MRLPRRVPWRFIEDLDEVCSWIYSPESNDTTKQAAINKVGYDLGQKMNICLNHCSWQLGVPPLNFPTH